MTTSLAWTYQILHSVFSVKMELGNKAAIITFTSLSQSLQKATYIQNQHSLSNIIWNSPSEKQFSTAF